MCSTFRISALTSSVEPVEGASPTSQTASVAPAADCSSSIQLSDDDETGRYSVEIPEGFFTPGVEVKFEVLAREESYNQTAIESCAFEVAGDEED